MDLIDRLRERSSFLTTKEVMELLQLRRNTLCHWVRAGRLPAIRSGTGYLYDPHRLADWLDQRTTGPASRLNQRHTEQEAGL